MQWIKQRNRIRFLGSHLITRRLVGWSIVAILVHSPTVGSASETCITKVLGDLGQVIAPKPALEKVLQAIAHPNKIEARFPEAGDSVMVKKRVDLVGRFYPVDIKIVDAGDSAIFSPKKENLVSIHDEKYVEFPNSTGLTTINPGTLEQNEIVIARAIHAYENKITQEGKHSPMGYSADEVAFVRYSKTGKLEPHVAIIKSRPDLKFFFEDGRICTLDKKVYMAGTDYAEHMGAEKGMFVRNGVFEVPLDPKTGYPDPVVVNADTGRPAGLRYISPAPRLRPDGSLDAVDAKNGVFFKRQDGKIVLSTRFRFDYNQSPVYQAWHSRYGDRVPKSDYAIQSYVFDSPEQMFRYFEGKSGDQVLQDLYVGHFKKRPDSQDPAFTATAGTFRKNYPLKLLVKGGHEGFGNGAQPRELFRRMGKVYMLDSQGVERLVGVAPTGKAGRKFVLQENDHAYFSPMHDLATLADVDPQTGKKIRNIRWYEGMFGLSRDGRKFDVIFGSVVQPREVHQIGQTGILELHHAGYFMGSYLVPTGRKIRGEDLYLLRTTSGAADAHTETHDWNMAEVLKAMSLGSQEWNSGQVYRPIEPRKIRSFAH